MTWAGVMGDMGDIGPGMAISWQVIRRMSSQLHRTAKKPPKETHTAHTERTVRTGGSAYWYRIPCVPAYHAFPRSRNPLGLILVHIASRRKVMQPPSVVSAPPTPHITDVSGPSIEPWG